MQAAALLCALVALRCCFFVGDVSAWTWCLAVGITAAGHALYSPARYAVLPAGAKATGWSLARVMAWMEGGSALGIVGGLLLAWELTRPESFLAPGWPLPALALYAVVVINMAAFLLVSPVSFPDDAMARLTWSQATRRFFGDVRCVLADPAARSALFGLSYLMALVTVTIGALIAYSLRLRTLTEASSLTWIIVATSIGTALGSALTSLQTHLRRGLGFAAPCCLLLAGTLLLVLFEVISLAAGALVLGFLAGLVNAPFRTAYVAAVPARSRGNGLAIMNAVVYLTMSGASALFYVLVAGGLITVRGQIALATVFAVVGGIAGFSIFKRETVELLIEFLLWPLYRIHGRGPGLAALPFRGPAIVIANHAAWLDPIWLGKVMTPALTPLMTSRFFDKPVLRWLMQGMNAAIRVEDTGKLRRDIPELDAAIELLDKGGTVLIFPEGYMRRKDEMVLRRFGQGIWRILCKRPQTPIFPCWIDGGWGSYFSYWHGLPTKNKRMDWWRTIDIGVSEPIIVDAETLADLNETRTKLMRACLDARRWLGREPYALSGVDSNEPEAPGGDGNPDE
jgi:1-acyl-sn-glycerol-3-phosphate acyltransferase